MPSTTPTPPSPGSLSNPHVPGTSTSSRPLLSVGSGWGNQGSSGGGVGIRGGGRMCRCLDKSEGRVTSPPCRREDRDGVGWGGVSGYSPVGR